MPKSHTPNTLTLGHHLNPEEAALLRGLDSPARIQAFLDETPYSPEDRNRCPLNVLRDRQAHYLDGALFAAAALERLGYSPRLVDLFPEPGMDDDHVLAIFKRGGALGQWQNRTSPACATASPSTGDCASW